MRLLKDYKSTKRSPYNQHLGKSNIEKSVGKSELNEGIRSVGELAGEPVRYREVLESKGRVSCQERESGQCTEWYEKSGKCSLHLTT